MSILKCIKTRLKYVRHFTDFVEHLHLQTLLQLDGFLCFLSGYFYSPVEKLFLKQTNKHLNSIYGLEYLYFSILIPCVLKMFLTHPES